MGNQKIMTVHDHTVYTINKSTDIGSQNVYILPGKISIFLVISIFIQ
jgi:hypothetical protein